MTRSLIRFDDNHMSINQLQMAEDRVLEAYICNLLTPPLLLIEPYLRDVGFSHVALVRKWCKLDPTLVSTLVERWRLETHKFHLPCNKCTITLEDVQLQLELLVDGRVVTGYMQRTFEEGFGDDLRRPYRNGLVKKKFRGLDEDSTKIQIEQHAWVYIIQIIGGILMSDKSRNLIHLRWNYGPSYAGLPNEFRDIQLLLDQRSEVEVPLVVYATMEIHEPDRVLRQFGFRQSILVKSQELDDLHPIHLQGRTDENWPIFYVKYINMWNNRYEFLPIHEAIVTLELAYNLDYMQYFRVYCKPYLLGEEVRS
ncbi:hypothetical protein J1N35_029495 [Gossypium stocksii]|uniref:Aminotransferase-like plant mobile domain-containing protein n=1 Tax=Gossypium stocksii TaxID=47602 RepID=A0A9D3ZT55_9ROSI|nr:hypothetical protein J1N35_029495 [Gossypium stocksii]